ncbi:MAG: RHS repeat-associated core domain-containing protein [Candidatus Saccharicenans sp.]|nr:RHS repeat-associated core domain-containing protein [Candidatus Saccharicenans sp.]
MAEYQPASGKYYYYTTDQINSTRVVTDDEGNVVYSAVHDPYGGLQQTWVNTFNPGWKFSGHEQDPESSLYYFGARYYDSTLYRFLCPDPAFNVSLMKSDMQHWNLYSYCRDNPLNFIDFTGLYSFTVHVNIIRLSYGALVPDSRPDHMIWMRGVGLTLYPSGKITPTIGDNGKAELKFELDCHIYILPDEQLKNFGTDYASVIKHEMTYHKEFVELWVSMSLSRIEKKWREEMKKDPQEALKNAYKRFEKTTKTAEWISNILHFASLNLYMEVVASYWDEIDRDWLAWKYDPYMAWLLMVPYAN